MTTNILAIGDLHFQENDPFLYNLFIQKVDGWLSTKKYDCCILLGDIQHKFKNIDSPSQSLVCLLFKTILKPRHGSICKLYAIVGNHDYNDSNQFLTESHSLLPFKEWPNVVIVDSPIRVKLSNVCTVAMCPYVPKGRLQEALVNTDLKNVDILFCHQEFVGGKMGAIVSTDGDFWPFDNVHVISGHLHNRHTVGKNITYIGMPYDLGWDESQKRYVTEIIFAKDTYKMNFIKTDMPRKIVIRLDYQEALTWSEVEEGNYYKLKVICSSEEYKQFIKSSNAKDLRKKGVKLIHVPLDEKKIEAFLQKKREDGGKCDKYSVIFDNLVSKENTRVSELYKKLFA